MDAETTVALTVAFQGVLKVLELVLHLYAFLFPGQPVVKDNFNYDFIIVGAGSAGCVLARRLSDNENINVLLVEAGGNPPIEVMMPGLIGYSRGSDFEWNYTTVNDNYSFQCYKKEMFPTLRGHGLGGSSSINHMIYTRGDPNDYNEWADITRNPTWNYDNVVPYFKKIERNEDQRILNSEYGKILGTNGEVGVNTFPDFENLKYLRAINEMGYQTVLNTNGDNTLGFNFPLYNIADGTRQSSCYCYISPVKDRKNLHVLRNTKVTKVLFHNKKAIGVEMITENNKKITAKANFEVILSAGVFNSPKLLMLSGIGPKSHLKSHKIKTRVNLPVGYNLQGQIGVTVAHLTDKLEAPATFNPFVPPLNFINGFVSLNKSQSYPDVQYLMLPSRNAQGMLQFFAFHYPRHDDVTQIAYEANKEKEMLLTFIIDMRPLSRGRITLYSADANDQPRIDLGAFSDSRDVDNIIRYIKDYLRIEDTSYFKNVNAERIDFTGERCKYFEQYSDEYWRCYSLCLMLSPETWSSTCAMGKVVDSNLRVFGVRGLRVVDASVFPTVPSGLTNAAAMMVAEKAADMIKTNYGI